MAALILRITGRGTRTPEFRRFEGGCVRVGRGLDNELILPDPYLGAEQFRILREDGALWLELRDRTNPLRVNGRPCGSGRCALSPGDEITVGHTTLTVLLADTPVAPARALSESAWMQPARWQAPAALLLLLATTLCSALLDFLDSVETIEWVDVLAGGLYVAAIPLVWASAWAALGRLTRHQAHFWAQLALASVFVLLAMCETLAVAYLAYATGVETLLELADWAFTALLLFVLLWGSLRLATGLARPWLAALPAAVLPLALLAVFEHAGSEAFSPQPQADTLLLAPFAKLRDGMSLEAYDAALGELFEDLAAEPL